MEQSDLAVSFYDMGEALRFMRETEQSGSRSPRKLVIAILR
jgi:hypothetical protein